MPGNGTVQIKKINKPEIKAFLKPDVFINKILKATKRAGIVPNNEDKNFELNFRGSK
jgi:hypothetical protein